MRLIGHVPDEASAQAFADFLYVQGIQNQTELEKDKGWAIWIQDEDQIGKAATLLEEFRSNPGDPKYRTQAEGAARMREQAAKSEDAYRRKLKNRRHLFRPLRGYGFGPLTFLMIAVSLFVYLMKTSHSDPMDQLESIKGWLITDFTRGGDLDEIRRGEVWRLLTPIFIHFSLPHIIFNLLALRDFGSMIEARQSSLHLLLLTLVFGVGSNLGEYYISGHVLFGGMSGVLYGLMGYIWMRGKFDPGSGLYLHPTTVTMMIIWFFACLLNYIGHVANAAHAVGLVMGMAWGWISSQRFR